MPLDTQHRWLSEYDREPPDDWRIRFQILNVSANGTRWQIVGCPITDVWSRVHPDRFITDQTSKSGNRFRGTCVPNDDRITHWTEHAQLSPETRYVSSEVLKSRDFPAVDGIQNIVAHTVVFPDRFAISVGARQRTSTNVLYPNLRTSAMWPLPEKR